MARDERVAVTLETRKEGDADALRRAAADAKDLGKAVDGAGDQASQAARDFDRLEAQTKQLAAAVDRAEKELEQFKAAGGGLGGVTAAVGGLKTAFAGLGIGIGLEALRRGIAGVVEASRVQVEALAQVEATIKSTGGAAGVTGPELEKMAAGLQKVTTFGDEVVLKMQSVLLTFTSIGAEIFPQASEAVLNLSTRLGVDLTSAATQVGKALNDPIAGLTSLTRSGIQFSDAQKETIKALVETGDKLGAQKIILAELETQFGGAARAARETFGGAIDAAGNVVGDLAEKIGSGGLNQALQHLADQLSQSSGQLEGAATAIGKVVGVLATGLGVIPKTFEAVGAAASLAIAGILEELGTAAAAITAALGSAFSFVGAESVAGDLRKVAQEIRDVAKDFGENVEKDAGGRLSRIKEGLSQDLDVIVGIVTGKVAEGGGAASSAIAAEGDKAAAAASESVDKVKAAIESKSLGDAVAKLVKEYQELPGGLVIPEELRDQVRAQLQVVVDLYAKAGQDIPPQVQQIAAVLNSLGAAHSDAAGSAQTFAAGLDHVAGTSQRVIETVDEAGKTLKTVVQVSKDAAAAADGLATAQAAGAKEAAASGKEQEAAAEGVKAGKDALVEQAAAAAEVATQTKAAAEGIGSAAASSESLAASLAASVEVVTGVSSALAAAADAARALGAVPVVVKVDTSEVDVLLAKLHEARSLVAELEGAG